MSVSQVICLTTARPDPIVLRPGVDTVLTVTGQADHEGWYRAATLMLDCQVCGGLPCPRAIAIAIAIVWPLCDHCMTLCDPPADVVCGPP